MFKFLEKFSYIIGGILIISYGYHYANKHYPKADLPYKNEIFRLEKIVIYKLNKMIKRQEDIMEEESHTKNSDITYGRKPNRSDSNDREEEIENL